MSVNKGFTPAFLCRGTLRASVVFAAAAVLPLLTSCDTGVHAIVGPTNPIAPSPNPLQYASLVSATANPYGLGTILDVSGDSILPVVQIGPCASDVTSPCEQQEPVYTVENSGGSEAFSVTRAAGTGNGAVSIYTLSTTLITSQVATTTLPNGSFPGVAYWSASRVYVSLTGTAQIEELSANSFGTYSVVGTLPTTGTSGAVENFAANAVGPFVFAIQPSANEVDEYVQNASPAIADTLQQSFPPCTGTPDLYCMPSGSTPVYGLISVDGRRGFVMDKGTNSVTPFDVQGNRILPDGNGNPISIPVGTGPVWADEYNLGSVLVVANSGSTAGSCGQGSVSVIDAAENSSTFGQRIFADVPVGNNPVGVVVLQDGSKAYVANGGCSANETPSITIVNLQGDTSTGAAPGSATTIHLPAGYFPFEIAISNSSTKAKVLVLTQSCPPADTAACTNPTPNPTVTFIRTYADNTGPANVIESELNVNGTPTWVALQPTR